VVVPTTYVNESGTTRPLIVVFDMQNSINYNYIVNTIDYLSGFGQTPECIVVGVEAAERSGRYYETQLKENDVNALGAEISLAENKYLLEEEIKEITLEISSLRK
jgi:enterochelin esterase-like enzyme